MRRGRPTKKEKELIEVRNRYIIQAYEEVGSQSQVARIFRLPRNTVYKVIKTDHYEKSEDHTN